MSDIKFSNRILRRFAETVALELGADQFSAMLNLSKLPPLPAQDAAYRTLGICAAA